MRRPVSLDAYAVLGVTPRDDFATIKKAWRKLVRENHPDVAQGDPEELTRRLTAINEAYDAMVWHRGPKSAASPPKPTDSAQADPKAAAARAQAAADKRKSDQEKKTQDASRCAQSTQTRTKPKAKTPPRPAQRSSTKQTAPAPAPAGVEDTYAARMFRNSRRILNAATKTDGTRLARCV